MNLWARLKLSLPRYLTLSSCSPVWWNFGSLIDTLPSTELPLVLLATDLHRGPALGCHARDLHLDLDHGAGLPDQGRLVQEPISRIINAVRRALEMTPPELASDVLEHGIMLTGGSSLIRGLDQRLMDETGLPVRMDEDPLTSWSAAPAGSWTTTPVTVMY